jgi:hypothetical protein
VVLRDPAPYLVVVVEEVDFGGRGGGHGEVCGCVTHGKARFSEDDELCRFLRMTFIYANRKTYLRVSKLDICLSNGATERATPLVPGSHSGASRAAYADSRVKARVAQADDGMMSCVEPC